MRIEKSLLLLLITFLSLGDILTTYIGLSKGLIEENLFLSSLGNSMFIIMGLLKIIVIFLSYFLLKKNYIFPAIIVSVLMGLAVINNMLLLI